MLMPDANVVSYSIEWDMEAFQKGRLGVVCPARRVQTANRNPPGQDGSRHGACAANTRGGILGAVRLLLAEDGFRRRTKACSAAMAGVPTRSSAYVVPILFAISNPVVADRINYCEHQALNDRPNEHYHLHSRGQFGLNVANG